MAGGKQGDEGSCQMAKHQTHKVYVQRQIAVSGNMRVLCELGFFLLKPAAHCLIADSCHRRDVCVDNAQAM